MVARWSRARGIAWCLSCVGLLARAPHVAASDGLPAAPPAGAPAVAVAPAPAYRPSARETAFLDQLQRDTFDYFWETSPADTGLTPDRAPGPDVSSVAAVGFALTAYLVGVERGWATRGEAAARTLTTLDTLWRLPQGEQPEGAAGVSGLFYHFLDAHRGDRAYRSEVSTIDTALLLAGVLAAQAYFDRDEPVERSIRQVADALYRRADWTWAYSPGHPPLLGMGWTPERGFLPAYWRGYNEAMILYVLALGSPTHPIDARAWDEWTRSYRWEEASGAAPFIAFGPLFGHQYSHVWIDFRGIQDRPMRERRSDYFLNSVRATYANRDYCVQNPGGWKGYGAQVWGVTASDGPVPQARGRDGRFHAYWARGAAPDGSTDDGTIAPTAAGGSVPFAPELAVPTLLGLRDTLGERVYGRYGFKDAFNLSYPGEDGAGWFADVYLGIDQGPILLMIENYRSGLVWNLLKRSPYVVAGLRRAGFEGGWLAAAEPGAPATLPAVSAPGPTVTSAEPTAAAAPTAAAVEPAPPAAPGHGMDAAPGR
jgi:hypothetical protein